jgi:four helix bundle protein
MASERDWREAGEIKSYRDLIAWQKAFEFGLRVHATACGLPESEKFGLASQLRRGAVSVASNIAEGYGRGSRADYIRFLKIARGALFEIDTQLMFAQRFGYLTDETFSTLDAMRGDCERLLAALIRGLET